MSIEIEEITEAGMFAAAAEKTAASESALNDLLCANFLRLKGELQGSDSAAMTSITYLGDGKYNLILPCKGGQYDCGIVSEDNLKRMINDMVNILGA